MPLTSCCSRSKSPSAQAATSLPPSVHLVSRPHQVLLAQPLWGLQCPRAQHLLLPGEAASWQS